MLRPPRAVLTVRLEIHDALASRPVRSRSAIHETVVEMCLRARHEASLAHDRFGEEIA
jgi:hypothetical protein